MAVKTPIRTVFDESNNATGLAEFQSGEFIGVAHGGIGAATLTTNAILLGNGTNAIQNSALQISGSTLSSSDSTLITIDDGLNVTGNLSVDGNLTVTGTLTSVNSQTINITNSFSFEGSTPDGNETQLTVVDPTADRTITLPNATGNVAIFTAAMTAAIADGSDGQVLKTDGSGVLSFGAVATDLSESTLSTAPGSDGNFDLSFDPEQSTQETPFEAGSADAFGIALTANLFSYNDPVGSTNTIDLGALS